MLYELVRNLDITTVKAEAIVIPAVGLSTPHDLAILNHTRVFHTMYQTYVERGRLPDGEAMLALGDQPYGSGFRMVFFVRDEGVLPVYRLAAAGICAALRNNVRLISMPIFRDDLQQMIMAVDWASQEPYSRHAKVNLILDSDL